MFEQDYIMRQIKEMVRALLKLLFNTDTESPGAEVLKTNEDRQTLENLLDMVDGGRIDEAENRLFELSENGDAEVLKLALLFYSHLNDKSDEFLEAHDFSREEIRSGIRDMAEKYGVGSFSDLLL